MNTLERQAGTAHAAPIRLEFDPNRHAQFDVDALARYACSDKQAVVLDLMTLVAAVERADRSYLRSSTGWGRHFALLVPVFELSLWSQSKVVDALVSALSLLTGDRWDFDFTQRTDRPATLPQAYLDLGQDTQYVMAYSNGLDSRSVAAIYGTDARGAIQLVRVGSELGGFDGGRKGQPFTRVPYRTKLIDRNHAEPSGRSRGFKFSVISGIASYLGNVQGVLVPESGQGMLGPSLVNYMHAYPDFRNSPRFFSLIQAFLKAVLDHDVTFFYPRIWSTKGETVREALERVPELDLTRTRSCWMQRQVAYQGRRLQCGVCAACLLRRMSLYVAGVAEEQGTYICDNLGAPSVAEGALKGSKLTRAFLEYGIAGPSQMFDLATLDASDLDITLQCVLLGEVMGVPADSVQKQLGALVERHRVEWDTFVGSLGSASYLRNYCGGGK